MANPYHFEGKASRKASDARSRRKRRLSAATEAMMSQSPCDYFPGEYSQDKDEAMEEELPRSEQTVPKALVKFIVGLFLLPFAWVLTETFLQAFTTSLHHGLLATQTFGCFAAGGVLFAILYLIIPQKALMIPYVLGHEVTHAIWAWLFGGKVEDHFHVSLEGGHVMTDRVNTWIVLAPYFFPIYSVLVVSIYGAASCVADISALRWLLFLLLGVTLAFHLVFTTLLIIKGQPDLHYGGTFFSLTVIYLINLLLITGLLLATSRIVTLPTYGRLLAENSADFAETCRELTSWLIAWVSALYASFAK
jgi:hypothetical protein